VAALWSNINRQVSRVVGGIPTEISHGEGTDVVVLVKGSENSKQDREEGAKRLL